MSPRIGITCDFETVTDRRGAPSPRFIVPAAYVAAVRRAGGDPILLPHVDVSRAASYLAIIDGLVVAGGDFDIPPDYYGQKARKGLGKVLVERSAFERALTEAALEHDLPMLGVCGGMQLLNVVLGGSLHQDLAERPGTGVHIQRHDKRKAAHGVEVAAGSLLAKLTGAARLEVNSTHHQIIHALGRDVVATGTAEDGVVEAIESTQHGFALGVQWHPEVLEADEHGAIYCGLVKAADAFAHRKR
ncbi:MAG: gamma-glutamyl-gamma-aminobutyrate hydrolase family protein [Clostridia bacterium]|nr:gamma-glutamyl-gamma-aminobutyrate hydrolase family protein [Deltaproteobacteria bacterium]